MSAVNRTLWRGAAAQVTSGMPKAASHPAWMNQVPGESGWRRPGSIRCAHRA